MQTTGSLLLPLECALLFIGIPLALRREWIRVPWIFPLMIVAALATLWLRRRGYDFRKGADGREWRRVTLRFIVATLLLVALAAALRPHDLFLFPVTHTRAWLLLLAIYPFVSALPQEIIYRAFFIDRYERLFGRLTPAASAVVFSFLHILYGNRAAVAITLAGGLFFADTYTRTRSLRLVWLEHAAYGAVVFTVGFAESFYSPAFA